MTTRELAKLLMGQILYIVDNVLLTELVVEKNEKLKTNSV